MTGSTRICGTVSGQGPVPATGPDIHGACERERECVCVLCVCVCPSVPLSFVPCHTMCAHGKCALGLQALSRGRFCDVNLRCTLVPRQPPLTTKHSCVCLCVCIAGERGICGRFTPIYFETQRFGYDASSLCLGFRV